MSRRHTPRDATTNTTLTLEPTGPSPADLAASIRASLHTLENAWPHLIDPPKPAGVSTRTAPGSKPPAPIAPLSLRVEILHDLAFWCHALLDDHPVALADEHPLDLANPYAMISHLTRHAHTAATWEHGNRLALELEDHAHTARAIAWPRTGQIAIGFCPLPNPDTGEECGGKVRVKDDPNANEHHGAVCSRCREFATIDWWYANIVGNPEAKTLVTASEVTVMAAYELGAVLQAATVRKWVERGWLVVVEKDAKGRSLFSREEAMSAVRQRLKVLTSA